MDDLLKQLLYQLQQHPRETEERQKALIELVAQMLRSRQICRPPKGQSLSSIYLDIFQAVQRQLSHDVDENIDSYNLQRTSVKDWANRLRDNAFQKVLNNSRLTLLALEAQRHLPRTQEWQYALRELLNAIQLSGKLSRPNQFYSDVYEDAITRTWFWICQNINAYNPSKGDFMPWVNYRLNMILQEIFQELKDPLIQSLEAKVIRNKYQLNAIIKRMASTDFKYWLLLEIKGLLPRSNEKVEFIFILSLLVLLSQLFAQKPLLGNSLLIEMSKECLYFSSKLPEISKESRIIEDIAQPEEKPFLSEAVRQYIESDPAKLFQKHIRKHPQVTFQAIALARLDGKTWKEMSSSFGIGIPALSNFFQRSLRELAPEIRKYVQEFE